MKKYRISEISEITGQTAHTLRYYEKEGLLKDIERDEKGIRSYSEKDLEMVKVIICLKETGMPIKEIKNYVDIFRGNSSTYKERVELFKLQREKVLKKMDELQAQLDMADYKIWYYENMETLGDEKDPLNCQKMRAIYDSKNK